MGNHEIAFDENNEPITGMMEIPEKLPEGADPAVAAFYNYYAVRARHPRAVNFVSSWMATMPVSFWNFKLMTNSKRYLPVRFCWLPEKMHIPVIIRKMPMPQLQKPKELVIVPDADHVALYDNMEKIPFDKLEQKIALGAWSWGAGAAGGDQVFGNHLFEEELKPVFEKAVECGLNLWDTAAVYGEGTSERILGNFVKDVRRDSVILSTKFTPQIAGSSPDAMQEMIDGSKERLHTDMIDVYWIHNPMDAPKWTPDLIPLAKSGQIKTIGVSNHNLAEIKRANEILTAEGLKISAVQNHYSLLHRSSEQEQQTQGGGNTMTGDISFNFETKTVLLNSGYEMPIYGIGTYSLTGDTCVESVTAALNSGVRLIDTAYMYHNDVICCEL